MHFLVLSLVVVIAAAGIFYAGYKYGGKVKADIDADATKAVSKL